MAVDTSISSGLLITSKIRRKDMKSLIIERKHCVIHYPSLQNPKNSSLNTPQTPCSKQTQSLLPSSFTHPSLPSPRKQPPPQLRHRPPPPHPVLHHFIPTSIQQKTPHLRLLELLSIHHPRALGDLNFNPVLAAVTA